MSTYTIDKRPKRLRHDDKVIFSVPGQDHEYTVCDDFLSHERWANDAIFKALALPRHYFASSAYGYMAMPGDWPVSRYCDFAALCRLVNALYDEIASRSAGSPKKEGSPSGEGSSRSGEGSLRPKVGDLVRIVTDRWEPRIRKGSTGILREDDHDIFPFWVATMDGMNHWFEGSEIQIVEQEPSPSPTSLGWVWAIEAPSFGGTIEEGDLFPSHEKALEEANRQGESPVWVFELFSGPVTRYTSQLVKETL